MRLFLFDLCYIQKLDTKNHIYIQLLVLRAMSKDNRLHAFTISPQASDIISNIRVKKKSQFVSEAIIHYRTWQYTDHTAQRLTEHLGVKDLKDINLALEEKQRLLETWVKRANEFQERVIELENKTRTRKWWQFW